MLCSARIENEIRALRETHFKITEQWTLSGLFGSTYPLLLCETYHYVKHSIPLMALACSKMNNFSVQRYLVQHMNEEYGHEQWALDDLEALGFPRERAEKCLPLQETAILVGTQLYVVNYMNPVGLMGYVYVMESMPPKRQVLRKVVDVYGLPISAMKFLLGHGEADQRHMVEIQQVLDSHVRTEDEIEAVIFSARSALSSLNNLFNRLQGDVLAAAFEAAQSEYRQPPTCKQA
jgi:pyrroloquinoline quinone (PQQ) biosynthesis protein C